MGTVCPGSTCCPSPDSVVIRAGGPATAVARECRECLRLARAHLNALRFPRTGAQCPQLLSHSTVVRDLGAAKHTPAAGHHAEVQNLAAHRATIRTSDLDDQRLREFLTRFAVLLISRDDL